MKGQVWGRILTYVLYKSYEENRGDGFGDLLSCAQRSSRNCTPRIDPTENPISGPAETGPFPVPAPAALASALISPAVAPFRVAFRASSALAHRLV